MTRMVQVAVAGDVTEAEELADDPGLGRDRLGARDAVEQTEETRTRPQKVLVPESSLEAAQDAVEALTEPDELIDEQS